MIQIRECKSEDFDNIVPLLRQLWTEKDINIHSLRRVYEDCLDKPDYKYICAINDEKILAFGSLSICSSLWQEGRMANIDELVVDEQYREKGIGDRLLNALINNAKKSDCRCVKLSSGFHRKEAHKFYETRGFENKGNVFYKFFK